MPRDPRDREAIESLVAWVNGYTLARTAGQPEDADAVAGALSKAHALGHAPTIARLEHRAGLDAMSGGRLEDAVLAFDRAIISAAEGGDTRRLVFTSILHAHALARLKRSEEAERSRRRARAHWDAIAADPMDVYSATLEDAATLLDLGRADEALAMSEPLLEPSVYAELSTGNRATLHARLGSANVALERPDAAAEHFQRQLDLLRAWLEPGSPSLLTPMANLAVALESAGRLEEAVDVYDDVRAVAREHMAPEHLDRIFFESNAGYAMANVPARRAEAITLLEDVVERADQHATPMVQAQSLLGLAKAHALAGNGPDAVDAYRRARVIAEAELGPDHPQTLDIVAKIQAVELEE